MINHKVTLELIDTIYRCGCGDAEWQDFLDRFGRLFPALKIALTGYDNEFSHVTEYGTANFDPCFVADFKAYYFRINPWQNVVLNSPRAPDIVWGHEAVPIRDLEKTEFYAGWVKPQGDVATGFTTMLVKDDDRFINLSANVNPKHIKEAQSAAHCIALIGPHLRRAFELNRQLMGARFNESTYQSVLDMLPAAVFIVDARAKIRFSNSHGERLLSQEWTVKSGPGGSLSFADAHDHRAAMESIRRCALRIGDSERDVIPIHAAPMGRYLAFVSALTTAPCAPARQRAAFLFYPHPIAVFVIDAREMPKAKIETVARALNVTRAEARLALAMMHDKPLKQYADENGISFHTARVHMRSLLEKTDSHRQAELVRRLANVFSVLN